MKRQRVKLGVKISFPIKYSGPYIALMISHGAQVGNMEKLITKTMVWVPLS